MIILDYDAYLREIKQNGIKKTDKSAKSKLTALMEDLVFNTTYSKGIILGKVRQFAGEIYADLPADLVKSQLDPYYKMAKSKKDKAAKDGKELQQPKTKTLILYKSEMEKINQIYDSALRRLAYALLIYCKYKSQYEKDGQTLYAHAVELNKTDLFEIAGYSGRFVGKRDEMIHKLSEFGLIEVYTKPDSGKKYSGKGKGKNMIKVPFCVEMQEKQAETEEVYQILTHFEDIYMPLDYYHGGKKAKGICVCPQCGGLFRKPKSSKQRVCARCLAQNKKKTDKKAYQKKCEEK